MENEAVASPPSGPAPVEEVTTPAPDHTHELKAKISELEDRIASLTQLVKTKTAAKKRSDAFRKKKSEQMKAYHQKKRDAELRLAEHERQKEESYTPRSREPSSEYQNERPHHTVYYPKQMYRQADDPRYGGVIRFH